MDIIDTVRYEDYPVDDELSLAYREVFNGNESSRKVLEDLMRECLWGSFSNDPDLQREIIISQKPLWRIKAMLNGKPTKPEMENEDE